MKKRKTTQAIRQQLAKELLHTAALCLALAIAPLPFQSCSDEETEEPPHEEPSVPEDSEAYSVPMHIVFNKTDLYTDDELRTLDELTALYESVGYPCHHISAIDGKGVDEMRHLLDGRITLFSGNSGVGKSTLINAIDPDLGARTGAISAYHDKGTHTTTYSEMFPVGRNGYIIDTPGIKGFGSVNMAPEEVSHYFREIFRCSADCKYGNCTHVHEPGCAVRRAVEEGRISLSRYTSYLNMLDDEHEDKYRAPY